MKTLICISALIIGTMVSCQKEEVTATKIPDSATTTVPPSTTPVVIVAPKGQLLLSGTFVSSGSYTTTGNVKVYEDDKKVRTLVFENFKTNNGPDLKIYMAEDNAITNFIQITDKVNINGSYTLPIPDGVDLKKQLTVVIWCKSFSRAFGSATLK